MATSSITTPVRVTREEDIMAICDAYEQSEKELDSFSDFRWMGGKEQKRCGKTFDASFHRWL